jgi:hypothetical protein
VRTVKNTTIVPARLISHVQKEPSVPSIEEASKNQRSVSLGSVRFWKHRTRPSSVSLVQSDFGILGLVPLQVSFEGHWFRLLPLTVPTVS